MAESIRSLVATLGYEVDTTGADRFNSSFNKLNSSINRLGGNYSKSVDKMKATNSRFVVTAGDLVNAIGKVASAGKEVFLAFADIQQARVTLAFRTSREEADSLINRVGEVTKATGGVVSQLDALNAITFGGNITDQMDFFINNLDKIIKLSKVAGKDFKETSDAIAQFIATGQGLDRLVELEVITARQKEALEVSGTAETLGKQGISARAAQAQVFLERGAPRVEEFFKEFQKTGGAAVDQLRTAIEDTNIIIGEKLNPAVTKLATGLKDSTNNFREALEKNGSFIDAWTASFNSDAAKAVIKLFGGVTGKEGGGIEEGKGVLGGTITNSQVNNITINANGANAEDVAAKTRSEIAKMAERINQNNSRKKIPKSINANIQTAQ